MTLARASCARAASSARATCSQAPPTRAARPGVAALAPSGPRTFRKRVAKHMVTRTYAFFDLGGAIGRGNDANDGGGNDGGDPPPSTSGYCTNEQSSRVSCLPSRNMDTWHLTTGENEKTIPSGKILSLPFTTRTSSTDEVVLVYTTDIGPLLSTQYSWRTWISQFPGGDIWNGSENTNCYTAGSQARAKMTVTQDQNAGSLCQLPENKATFYINYAVRGAAGYYAPDYKFGVARQ